MIIETGEVIPALGHNFSTEWSKDEINHWHVCTRCDTKQDEADHTLSWILDKAATEDETGLKHQQCNVCGYETSKDTVIEKLDHVHVGITKHEGKAATCTVPGEREYWTCSSDKCAGKKYGDDKCQTELTDLALPKDPNNHVGETELRNEVAATCTAEGFSGDTYCKSCTNIIKKGVPTPPLSHAWSAWTKVDDKQHKRTCSRCNTAEVEDHSFSNYVPDGNATATNDGTKTSKCDRCEATDTQTDVGSKIDPNATVADFLTIPPTADDGLEFFAKDPTYTFPSLSQRVAYVVEIIAELNDEPIDETDESYTFTIKIPQKYLRSGRVFTVYREHGGKVQALFTTQKGDRVTFQSNKFSLFALTYRDPSVTHWDDDDYEDPEYDLTFNTNGGSKLKTVTKNSGSRVNLNKYAPTKAGYDFVGWYSDRALTKEVTSITLYRDRTVYAKWAAKSASGKPNPGTGAFASELNIR